MSMGDGSVDKMLADLLSRVSYTRNLVAARIRVRAFVASDIVASKALTLLTTAEVSIEEALELLYEKPEGWVVIEKLMIDAVKKGRARDVIKEMIKREIEPEAIKVWLEELTDGTSLDMRGNGGK